MIFETALGAVTIYTAYKWLIDRDKQLKIINDTFKAIGFVTKRGEDELTPTYKGKSKNGAYLFKLPIGRSFEEIENKKNILEDAFPNNVVELEFEKGLLSIRIMGRLPNRKEWDESIINKGEWDFPIGYTSDGWIYHNFNDYPHLIVAGITRYGKTEFLKMLITSMVIQQPKHVLFAVIDLKGGLAFGRFEKLRQALPVASDFSEARNVLVNVSEIIKRRYEIFKRLGIEKIQEWDHIENETHERIFVLVDEAAELAPGVVRTSDPNVRNALNECQKYLSNIARIGAGLGVHLIFCTQYPTADTLDKQIKINSEAKLSFRLSTSVADKVVFDETGFANKIKPGLRGRAWYRTDKDVEVQVPIMENKYMERVIAQNKRVDDPPQSDTEPMTYAGVLDDEGEG